MRRCGFKQMLTAGAEDEYALVLNASGNMVLIIKVNDFKPVQYTILGWESAISRGGHRSKEPGNGL